MNCFGNCKNSDRRITKKQDFGKNFFHFQVFQAFGNSEIDFGISLKNVFDKLSIHLELRYVFIKILTHCKKDLKYTVTMPSHQGHCLIYIHGSTKFHCPEVRGS